MNQSPLFSKGDTVVYPSHGVGYIQDIETQEVSGYQLQVYVIAFEHDRLTVRLPLGRTKSAGLRKLSTEETFEQSMEILRSQPRKSKLMWSKKAQEFEAKINSGDPLSLAEVLRDLYKIKPDGEQSYSERQIFQSALTRLAREMALVKSTDLGQARQRIEEHLAL